MNAASALQAALDQQIAKDNGDLNFVALRNHIDDLKRVIARQSDRIVQLDGDLNDERALTSELRVELITAHEQLRSVETGSRIPECRNNVPLAQHLAVIHDLQQARTLLANATAEAFPLTGDDDLPITDT